MRKEIRLFLLAAVLLSLTGCASLLERRYVTSEPHSSKFWESEAAGTLRAENHQDIVNDLLVLIERHAENATLRLYHYDDERTVAGALESAAVETQQETPLGSYAVSYITSTSQAQRGYYEVKLQIEYRRTAEELAAIVNATSAEAVYYLLRAAWNGGRASLAVRIGYWGPDSAAQVEAACERLRAERLEEAAQAREKARTEAESGAEMETGTEPGADTDAETGPEAGAGTAAKPGAGADTGTGTETRASWETELSNWPAVRRYPENGPVGLIEFLLTDPEEAETAEQAQ